MQEFGSQTSGSERNEQIIVTGHKFEKTGKYGILVPIVLAGVFTTLYAMAHVRGQYAGVLPWDWGIEWIAPGYIPAGGMFLGFFVISPLFRILTRGKMQLGSKSMVIFYNALMLGISIVSGFVMMRIMTMMGLQFLSLQDNQMYQGALDLFSRLVIPKDMETVMNFYFGGTSVPWREWLLPIITWTIIYGIFYFVLQCIAVLVRRQWTDYEHLQFPIAQAVMAPVEKEGGNITFRNKFFVVGFVISAGITLVNTLHARFPAVPWINLGVLGDMFRRAMSGSDYEAAFTVWPQFQFLIDPMWVGMGYFVRLDLLFSIWFFHFAQYGLNMVLLRIGVLDGYRFPQRIQQFIVGSTAFGIFLFWQLRHQLKLIVVKALKGKKDGVTDDSNEPFSYRTAVFGLIGGFVALVVIARVLLHANPLYVSLFMAATFLIALAIGRMRSEAGLGWNGGADSGGVFMFLMRESMGVTSMGLPTVAGLGYLENMSRSYMLSSVATALEGMKMCDSVGISRRRFIKLMWFMFIISTFAGFATILPYIYSVGANGFSDHSQIIATGGHQWTIYDLKFDRGPSLFWALSQLFYFVFTGFLAIMHSAFMWWPFHPMGYVAGAASFSWMFVGGFFVAWLVKSLVLRYGGGKIYQSSKPLFVGLVVGEVIIKFLGIIIGVLEHI